MIISDYDAVATRMYFELETLFRSKFPAVANVHLAAIRCYGVAMRSAGAIQQFPPMKPAEIERIYQQAVDAMHREASAILTFRS